MLSKECSILILSCDKNCGLLNIFFEKFKENWLDCEYKVYLGVEKADFNYDNVIILNSKRDNYSDRLFEYLDVIKTDYILVMLDDFIIEDKVDNKIINHYFDYIYNDKSIANITLAWIDGKVEYNYCDTLQKKCFNANFLVNFQIGFWRKDILQSILVSGENAWQIELYGSIRAQKFKNYKFLHLCNDDIMPIVYNRGWLVVKGIWNGNEIKRLSLYKYSNYFLDGKEIKYTDFVKTNKINALRIRFGIFIRKVFSRVGIFF